jgi:hypothetical protein
MQFKILVLPAPFGPMIDVMRPGSISTLTPERACNPPKVSVTSETIRCVIDFSNADKLQVSALLLHVRRLSQTELILFLFTAFMGMALNHLFLLQELKSKLNHEYSLIEC